MQKDYTPVKQEPAVEVEPLEFNFSFEKTATTENTSQPVDEPEVSTTGDDPDLPWGNDDDSSMDFFNSLANED